MCRIVWDQVTDEAILSSSHSRRLSETATDQGMHFAGQVFRMNEQCPAKAAINWIQPDGGRKRGRPKKTWHQRFQGDLENIAPKWKGAEIVAADRELWCMLVAQCGKKKKRSRGYIE